MIEREVGLPVRLLRLLSAGGLRSTSELAQKLGISNGLVVMMVEDLTRRGYLVALSGAQECSTSCAGCGLASACNGARVQEGLPLLTLTPRGQQMAA